MRLSAATVGLLLGLALILSACGEDRTTAAGEPASTVAPTATDSLGKASTVHSPQHVCRRQLGPFIASLAALRDDLARGLSYDDYLARVKDTRAIYAKVSPKRIPAGCLLASGGPAERAFNLYIDAANTWGDCLATVTCSTRSIEPRLQRAWARAENRLALAQRGMNPTGNG